MRLIVVVRGNSDAGDELDGSSLGIAEERVLARTAPIQQPASIVPIAVRAAEEEAVNLRHLSSVTARTAGYCSLRKGGSRESAGRRPQRSPDEGLHRLLLPQASRGGVLSLATSVTCLARNASPLFVLPRYGSGRRSRDPLCLVSVPATTAARVDVIFWFARRAERAGKLMSVLRLCGCRARYDVAPSRRGDAKHDQNRSVPSPRNAL